VIHPFHPLFGQEFGVLFRRCINGEDWLFFQNVENRDNRIPTSWTSLYPRDPYLVISNGRSLFSPKDLLELVHLTKDLKATRGQSRQKTRSS
jgi:hypothetical protein